MFKSDDTGKLILRLVLGILVLLHGIAKLRGGVAGISVLLQAHGLPGALAYLSYFGEVVGPLLLIVGVYSRVGGAFIVINMLFAFGLVHISQLSTFTDQGGWKLELQAMYLFAAAAVVFLGAGRFSLGGKTGRYN
jgi:putative oxidoreductase